MKKNNRIYLLLTLVFCMVFSLFNCGSEDCYEKHISEIRFGFRLVDGVSMDNLIAIWGAKYNSEDVTMTNEDGSEVTSLTIGGDGNITFVIPDYNDTEEAIEKPVSKTFFLFLPDDLGTPGRDLDTLTFEFEFSDNNDCPRIQYESFKAIYNDSIYHDGKFETPILFTKK